MPFPPSVAKSLASLGLTEDEVARLAALHFQDAGHGYDAFGMHPSFVTLGMALASPLYDRYFHVTSRGHHHIPPTGPAILCANHSGVIPTDGAMLWADVLRHTNPPRVARPVADHFVPSLPWIGTLFARGGVVGGSRGNVRTLLDAGELLMIFPEGTPAIVKPSSEAYKLHRFRVGHAEMAIRHRVPVVPVGIVGAEEQLPQLANSRRLGKLVGLPRLPIPARPLPLPVHIHIVYGPPLALFAGRSPNDADRAEIVEEAAAKVRDAVAGLLAEGLEERPRYARKAGEEKGA